VIFQYSATKDSGIRIKRVKGEEKSALVCRRSQSIDRGQLKSAGEREGGSKARVNVLVDDRPI